MENKVIAKEYVDKNYIHKDLIRVAIEELEKKMQEDEVDEFGIHSISWLALDWTCDYLKKLLEDK